jgi:hypothetical protein
LILFIDCYFGYYLFLLVFDIFTAVYYRCVRGGQVWALGLTGAVRLWSRRLGSLARRFGSPRSGSGPARAVRV